MFDFNGWLNRYPGTNFHELNIDWVVESMKEIAKELQHFEIVNQIKYMGYWDITKQYPAWSLVTVNDTEGYISKQPVPVGINYDNTDYWVVVADFAVQIAGLGQRVINLEGEMLKANNDIDALETAVDSLNGYNNFSDRKVICMSDSYGGVPTDTASWIGYLKTYLHISNDNFYRTHYSGSGFIGVVANTFLNQMQTLAGTMSASDRNSIDDIIIGGGYNDASALNNGSSEDDMRTAISTCLTYIRSAFPNARVYLVPLGWGPNYGWMHRYLSAILNLYAQGCSFINRCSCIQGVDWLHRDAFCDSSGYHPTATASYCMALSIAGKILGGDVCCDLGGDITPHWNTDIAVQSFTLDTPIQIYRDGICYMSWQNMQFKPNSTWGTGDDLVIADFTDSIMAGGNNINRAYKTTVHSNLGDVLIAIYGNKIHAINLTGSSISAGTNVFIYYGQLTGPCTL